MNLDVVESDDDDAPPELVEAGTYIPPKQQEAAAAWKVPITIVTGMYTHSTANDIFPLAANLPPYMKYEQHLTSLQATSVPAKPPS